jgi:hypothetical protein
MNEEFNDSDVMSECSELEDGYDMKSYYSDTDSNDDGYQYERGRYEEETWETQECNDTNPIPNIPIIFTPTSPPCHTAFECSICYTNRCQECKTRKCSVCIHTICTSCWVKVDRCPYCRSKPLSGCTTTTQQTKLVA